MAGIFFVYSAGTVQPSVPAVIISVMFSVKNHSCMDLFMKLKQEIILSLRQESTQKSIQSWQKTTAYTIAEIMLTSDDLAVMPAYEFDRKITESECVAELMKLYKKLIK